MAKTIILLNICLFSALTLLAQNQRALDSLNQAYTAAKHDTTKILVLNAIAQEYRRSHPDTCIALASRALQISEKAGFEKGKGQAWTNIGFGYDGKAKYTEALEYHQKALLIFEKLNDKQGLAAALGGIGSIYLDTYNYPLALDYYQRSLEIQEKIGDLKSVSATLNNIGIIHRKQGKYLLAIECHQKSLNIQQKIGDKELQGMNYNSLGNNYMQMSNYPLAIESHQKGLKIAEEIGSKHGQAINLQNMGNIYYQQEEYTKALECCQKALEIQKSLGNKDLITNSNYSIGKVYQKRGDYPLALAYYREGLDMAKEVGNKARIALGLRYIGFSYHEQGNTPLALEYLRNALKIFEEIGHTWDQAYTLDKLAEIMQKQENYEESIIYAQKGLAIAQELNVHDAMRLLNETLYKTYKLKGDYAKALEHHELYKVANDSIFNTEKAKAIANLEANAELERKEKEIVLLNKAQEALEAQQVLQKRISYLILAGLLSTLALSFLIFRSRQKEKAAKEQVQSQNQEILRKNEEISQQKEEIQIQAEQLSVANATKDKLFAIIGHDLRSPIASLQGMFMLIADGLLTQKAFEKFSNQMLKEVSSLSFMLNNLLNWANSQLKGMEPLPVSIQLAILAKENTDFLENIALDKKVALNNQVPLEAHVWADPNQISVVFRNLISNAIKFTPEGGSVNILAEKQDNHWKVTVQDTGVGIPQDKVALIFRKNHSFTTQGTKGEKGTGLGLILCQEMIEKNNGQIGVESLPGKGTAFWFMLPAG